MASTELDIVISAQIQHQERIAKLINDVGKLQAQMNALNASSARAAPATQKFNNALDAQSKAARNARQGMQQAGMQINDFATSVSTGASPVQAFNQQIGQLGYAMSMMGGTVGKVGAFLAGPWSIAVIGAVMGLGYLYDKFVEVDDSAQDTDKSFEELIKTFDIATASSAELAKFNAALAQSNKNVEVSAIAAARAILYQARMQIAASQAKIAAVTKEKEATERKPSSLEQFTRGAAMGAIGSTGFDPIGQAVNKKVISLEKDLNDLNTAAAGLERQVRQAEGTIIRYSVTTDATTKRINGHKDSMDALEQKFRKGKISLAEYTQQMQSLDAAIKKLEATEKKAGGGAPNRGGSRSRARQSQDTTREVEREQAAWDRLREKMDDILTVQTAVDTATGRATKALQDYKNLITEIGAMTVDGKALGAEYLASRAADLQIAERRLREAMTDDSNADAYIQRQKEIGELLEKQKEQWKSVAMAVSDAFKGMISGAMGWRDALRGIINAVIDKLWEMYVVQQIVGFVTRLIGGGSGSVDVGGDLGASFDKAFGVKPYATGGYPQAGKAALVGERGPELFIPSSSGKIVGNHNLGGAGGMTINVDARGASDPAAVRAQVQQGILEAAPHILAAAEARTIGTLRRPRLGGAMQ